MFRKVFKRDRKRATCSDGREQVISRPTIDKSKKAVHLNDIHLEKGMHCVDCHFRQDAHGDGNLYNERAPRSRWLQDCAWVRSARTRRCSLLTRGLHGQLGKLPKAQSQNQQLLVRTLTRLACATKRRKDPAVSAPDARPERNERTGKKT